MRFFRQHLRERFPTKLWLDVLSKADLLEEEFGAADVLAASGDARLRDWDPSAVEHPAVAEAADVIVGGERAAADDLAVTGSSPGVEPHADVSLPAVQQAVSDAASISGSSGGSGRVYRWGDGSGSADVDGRQLAGASGAVDAAQVVSLPVCGVLAAEGVQLWNVPCPMVAASVLTQCLMPAIISSASCLQASASSWPSHHSYPQS